MDKSPLGRLLPELRNKIYEQVLYEPQSVAITTNFGTEPYLLRTCKQIRSEARLLFYSLNYFICATDLDDKNIKFLIEWLQRDPKEKLAGIQGLEISMIFTHLAPPRLCKPKRDFGEHGYALFEQLRQSSFGSRKIAQVVNFTVNNTLRDDHFGGEEDYPMEVILTCTSSRLAAEPILRVVFPERSDEALKESGYDFEAAAEMMREVIAAREEMWED